MIISHKHKYCFVEYPRSASYAIRKELLEHYDGQEWLQKHSRLIDFKKSVNDKWREYFIFCSIRHPLADVISVYNINRKNNSGRAEADWWKKYKYKWFIQYREMRRAKFFSDDRRDISFQNFFNKMFNFVYIKPRILAELKSGDFSDIIRVESLEEDFKRIVRKLNLDPSGEITHVNVSTTEKIDFDQYYPERIRKKAIRILGPIVKYMEYSFPESWGDIKIPLISSLLFRAAAPLAGTMWNWVNYKKTPCRTIAM